MICFRIRGVSLRLSFGFFTVLGLLCTLEQGAYLWHSVCAILIHESMHLLLMLLLRMRLHSVTFYGCGIRLRPAHMLCSYGKELLVLLAGPFGNLLVWGILMHSGGDRALAGANLALGLMNLLPCRHLDGGAALRCIFGMVQREPWRTERLITGMACAVLLLMIVGAWLLEVGNFTYYALCIYLLFAEIFR